MFVDRVDLSASTVIDTMRLSAASVNNFFGASDVTLSRGAVRLSESITGDPATVTAGVAAAGAFTLPLTSAVNIRGKVSPGVTVTIAGHTTTYTNQSKATPVGATVSLSIKPGLSASTSGEAITLAPKQIVMSGRQIKLRGDDLPPGWKISAEHEIWSLVPADTLAGSEPRQGDVMTVPKAATISEVSGAEGMEYIVLLSPVASEETA